MALHGDACYESGRPLVGDITLFKTIESFGPARLRNQVDLDSLSAELMASLVRPWSRPGLAVGFDLPHASSGAPEVSTTDYLNLLNTNRYLRPAVQVQDTAALGRSVRAAGGSRSSSRWLSPCEGEPGGRRTCNADRRELLSWDVFRPLVTAVVPDAREGCGPDVAPARPDPELERLLYRRVSGRGLTGRRGVGMAVDDRQPRV